MLCVSNHLWFAKGNGLAFVLSPAVRVQACTSNQTLPVGLFSWENIALDLVLIQFERITREKFCCGGNQLLLHGCPALKLLG